MGSGSGAGSGAGAGVGSGAGSGVASGSGAGSGAGAGSCDGAGAGVGSGAGSGAGAGASACAFASASRFFAICSSFCFFFIAVFVIRVGGCLTSTGVGSEMGMFMDSVVMGGDSGSGSGARVVLGADALGGVNADAAGTLPNTIFGPTFLCPGIRVKSWI